MPSVYSPSTGYRTMHQHFLHQFMLNFSFGLKLTRMRMEVTNGLQNRGIKKPDLIPLNNLVVKEWAQPLCQIAHQEVNVLMVLCFMAAGIYTASRWSRWQEGFHVVSRLHFQFKWQHLAQLKERNKGRSSGYSVFQCRKTKTF